MSTTSKRIWTILRLAILVFLITGIIDVIIIASIVFRDTVQRGVTFSRFSDPIGTKIRTPWKEVDVYESLAYDTALTQNLINYKRLHLDIDRHGVAASYDVYLRKDHPLFLRVERDGRAERAEKLSNGVLGAVSVSNQSLNSERDATRGSSDQLLKFDRVETSFDDTDDNAHIFVAAAPYRPPTNSYVIKVHAKQFNLGLNIASKEILVHTRGVNVRSSSPYLPVSKTQDGARFVLAPEADELYVLVEVTDPVAETHNTLASLLRKEINIPGLNNLLYGLLEAIPFILFIFWCNRYAQAIPDAHLQKQIIQTYLVFHFSYFFFYSLSYLIDDWRSPFVWALSYFERRTLSVFAASNYEKSFYMLLPMMAMFVYVWPTFARAFTDPRAPAKQTSKWVKKGKQILAVLIFVGLLVFPGWLLVAKLPTLRTNLGLLTVADFYLLFFAVLLLVLYVLILLLGRAINIADRLGFALALFSLVILLIAAELFYIFAESSGNIYLHHANGVLSVILYSASAFAIVWAFAVLCYRAITRRSLHDDWRVWSVQRRLLFILALLAVALSTRSWTWPMRYWPLWSLVWGLKDLFFLVLAWFLVSFLHRASAEHDWLALPDSARDAGVFLALFLFYSPTTHWNYIPVSFIVGYFLLQFWLLPKKQFDRSFLSDIKSDLKKLIERVIAFNDAERALKMLKKELLIKLGKGDLEPQQYADKLSAQIKAVDTYRQDLKVRNQFAKDYVLALAPGKSAWENGYKTAYYSLLFSLPWSLLYLRDIVRAQVPSESYLLLDLVTNLLFFLLAWLSYGFIFGYFYPYIPGKNGIRKGVVMFVIIVVPELIGTALTRSVDGANWPSFAFWSLQIFVHTMLLGITSDLFIMRSEGFKWSHLLDFYRLTSLSAWASSVILAVAGAASALISWGATEILTSAFKYMGVIPEDVELPKNVELPKQK